MCFWTDPLTRGGRLTIIEELKVYISETETSQSSVIQGDSTMSNNRIHKFAPYVTGSLLLTLSSFAAAQATSAIPPEAAEIAAERQLSPDDVTAALMTYMPSGKFDEYMLFSSGGHSGQVFVIGVPSMRLLRTIAVFTPEPWQGYGYGVGNDILAEGAGPLGETHWGDTHHPALSETKGEYDGQFCFINDKNAARLAVIDLRDFETKQIIKNPLALSDHGGACVTPDTEYVIEGGQFAMPLGMTYAPMDQASYDATYRGMVTFWKFDRTKGRIDQSKSFAIELPPYWQDLFDAGKLASAGFVFGNSFCSERATGTAKIGDKNYFESGCSQADTDMLHIIDIKLAEKAAWGPKSKKINGMTVIPLDVASAEGVLYFAPEPKSPHGADVTPGGEFIVVSGKLDPHVTVYSIEKIKATIAAKKWTKDAYGVPLLDFDSIVEAQVELGLGPLHTQFDDKGYAYTSLFLDSAVARWTLGGPYASKHPETPWSLVGKVPVQYNIGHLGCAEGDTTSPDGKYLIAFNKWSLDRFPSTGPLLPQNFQLVDIAKTGDTMKVIYDMPVGFGEPHYAQMIKADKIKAWSVYPEIGWNPHTQSVDPTAAKAGEERIERTGSIVNVYTTVTRSHFKPERVVVKEGDTIIWHLTSLERAVDATHGFALAGHDINLSLEPGEAATIEFTATKAGVYPFYCSEFCSALHLEMVGYFLVEPAEGAAKISSDTATPVDAAKKGS